MYNDSQDITYAKMNNVDDERLFTIYMSDILKGVSKFWWVCVALSFIIGSAVFVKSYFDFTPVYKSTAVFTINTQDSTLAQGGISTYSFFYDSATASQLSDIFPYILSSSYLKDAICDDMDVKAVPASLSASSVENSNMFTLESVGRDPQLVYDTLVSAMKNYPDVARYVIGNVNFSVITEPEVAKTPFNKAEYKKETLIGAAVGFALGLLFILVYAIARKTVRTTDDITQELKIYNLGIFPKVALKKHKKEVNESILLTNDKIGDSFIEALRVTRNTLMNKLDEDEKIIMVTSTAPEEGKTTVISNLALSVSRMKKKVLIVDADLRNPSIDDILTVDRSDDNIIESQDTYTIYKYNNNVSVLNFNVNNYFNVLNMKELRSFFSKIKENYDYVFVDTPPCGLVSDTLIIAQAVDTVIYVVMQDTVRTSKIQSSIDELLFSDVKITGCILNAAESGLQGYGKYYGYGSYYKYGHYGYGRHHYGYGRHHYGYGDEN